MQLRLSSFWGFSYRHWLVLLSLGSERRHPVLGPSANDVQFRGAARAHRRGACLRDRRSRPAVAGPRRRPVQFVAVALDRRSAAVFLGPVSARFCGDTVVFPLLSQIYRSYYWIVAMALYALAKLFEFTDSAIYAVGGVVSGHTLKHLAAAGACFAVFRYLQVRQPAAGSIRRGQSSYKRGHYHRHADCKSCVF